MGYYQQKYEIEQIILAPTTVVLNQVVPQKRHILNFIVLAAKQYIYAQRCANMELVFLQFRQKIRTLESIEKYIAVKNDRLKVHNMKWATVVSEEDCLSLTQNMEQYAIQYINEM